MTLRATYFLSALLLVLAITVKVADPPFVRQFEHKIFDLYQQARPRPYTDAPVRIVDLDDESLSHLGQWPWPRTQLAKLVNTLQEAGAAAIIFDIVFAEPDRNSPQEMLKVWEKSDQLTKAVAALPDPDTVFADAIAHSNTVTGFVLTHSKNPHTPASKAGMVIAGEQAMPYLPTFDGAVVSLPTLEASAKGNGALNSDPDGDGILRRVPMVFRINDKLYPSLAAEALRTAQGASSYIVKTVGANSESGAGHGITALRIGKITIPTDPSGGVWIYFSESVPERYVPAWRIMDQNFKHDAIAGNIVLIGTSAAGLKDIRTTPLNPAAAGVEVHAQAIEQALLGISLSRPDWMKGAEICMILLATGIMVLASQRLRPIMCAITMLVLIAAIIGLSWQAFFSYQLLVEPVTSIMAVLLVYFSESLGRFMHSEEERRRIRHAFSHYMAPALVEDLARHPEKLTLGGENRAITVMFCDVRGFTTFSEQMGPAELTHLINRFLTPMTDIILRNHGTIDKYIGDCIMAFWNAPVDDPHHQRHAALSCLQMAEALVHLNKKREEEALAEAKIFLPLHIGIGVNTGECCVGNMGSDQRFNYSALGDEVNLASRLEGQCKLYGVDCVLGDSTANHITSMALLELDLICVKGKKQAKRIYTLLGDEHIATSEHFTTLATLHAAMLEAYREQAWDNALDLAEQCQALAASAYPETLDTLYELYMERCTDFQTSPPPEGWDGVYEATSK